MLEIDNIDVFYGKIQALRRVSLTLEKGEVYTIIGANGAGKTTLLRTIIGLQKLSNGHISFLGRDISNLPSFKRAKLGISMVLEGRGLFPDLTVYENLIVGAINRSDTQGINDDIKKFYELFPPLRDRRNQKAKTLSGGEGQMLAIARSLLSKPQLLLMDEPSSGLMPRLVNEIFKLIKYLSHQSITILLAEQNVSKSLSVAQKAAIMQLGRIVDYGLTQDLMGKPAIMQAYLGR